MTQNNMASRIVDRRWAITKLVLPSLNQTSHLDEDFRLVSTELVAHPESGFWVGQEGAGDG